MTAREKAGEIYDNMLNAGKGMISDHLAGECAMIAVEELLQQSEDDIFWKNVKKELKKMLNHKS